uniref:Uncharacterized protein n=1 Tax=Arundo donax TaxID=35708 RepID=A0A0A9HL66_ARUDO
MAIKVSDRYATLIRKKRGSDLHAPFLNYNPNVVKVRKLHSSTRSEGSFDLYSY